MNKNKPVFTIFNRFTPEIHLFKDVNSYAYDMGATNNYIICSGGYVLTRGPNVIEDRKCGIVETINLARKIHDGVIFHIRLVSIFWCVLLKILGCSVHIKTDTDTLGNARIRGSKWQYCKLLFLLRLVSIFKIKLVVENPILYKEMVAKRCQVIAMVYNKVFSVDGGISNGGISNGGGVICVGDLTDINKNTLELVDYFSPLDVDITILSDTDTDTGEMKCQGLKIKKKVPYSKFIDLLKKADGIIINSNYEGFPLVVSDALSMNKTVFTKELPYVSGLLLNENLCVYKDMSELHSLLVNRARSDNKGDNGIECFTVTF